MKLRELQEQASPGYVQLLRAIFNWDNLSGRDRQSLFERFSKSPTITRALDAIGKPSRLSRRR